MNKLLLIVLIFNACLILSACSKFDTQKSMSFNDSTTIKSDYNSTLSTSNSNTSPNPLSSLNISPLSTSQISVAWSDNSNNETGFEVQY